MKKDKDNIYISLFDDEEKPLPSKTRNHKSKAVPKKEKETKDIYDIYPYNIFDLFENK